MRKKLIALFSLFLILMACSSSEKLTPPTYVPPSNFDANSYVNPKDYGYDLFLYDKDKKESGDTSFKPVSFNPKQAYKNMEYPAYARKNGIKGQVIIQVYIDSTGTLKNMQVIESPHKILTKATKEAVMKTKFTPANLNGKPVNSFGHFSGLFQVQSRRNQ